AIVQLRWGAGNRDARRFGCPAEIDLERKQARAHLAFGVGTHHCLGAPLARRELFFGFKALVDRIDELWLAEDAEPLRYRPNYLLRILDELRIGFRPAASAARRRL